tara:strand:- start:17207 stop:17371 length:165 start_codon:yes stop_codon:yes gene_type:complete
MPSKSNERLNVPEFGVDSIGTSDSMMGVMIGIGVGIDTGVEVGVIVAVGIGVGV